VKLPFLAEPLGLDGVRWPAFVVHDIEVDKTFVFDQGREITEEGIGEFVEKFWRRVEGRMEGGEASVIGVNENHDELTLSKGRLV